MTTEYRGGCGYLIINNKTREKRRGIRPAGPICSSFTAEAQAGISAFNDTTESFDLSGEKRLVLHCLSLCQSLHNPEPNTLVQELHSTIIKIIQNYNCYVDVVWISSHSGIGLNEEVD